MKKILILILFLVGLALGPGYLLYCVLLSGSSIGDFAVPSLTAKSFEARQRDAASIYDLKRAPPIVLNLSPDMNPIAIKASASFPTTRLLKVQQDYLATLHKGDQEVWSEDFEMKARAEKGRTPKGLTLIIRTFEVEEAGEYTLRVIPRGKGNLRVTDFNIQVRRNVIEPRPVIFLSGMGMAALAFVIFIVSAVVRGGRARIKSGTTTRSYR